MSPFEWCVMAGMLLSAAIGGALFFVALGKKFSSQDAEEPDEPAPKPVKVAGKPAVKSDADQIKATVDEFGKIYSAGFQFSKLGGDPVAVRNTILAFVDRITPLPAPPQTPVAP